MKLTRHNGRSGKHGTYNPRHNDRHFNLENSEHISAERERQNMYWDCYRGLIQNPDIGRMKDKNDDCSFEKIELLYYEDHYGDFIREQNRRNEKTRHIERNRSVEDLLKNNKTCPEESIYQIGTMGNSVSGDTLHRIVNDFSAEFEARFGDHVHILDWALHMDEGTPHIHERHVFDCKNKYGELCPQQEKALEALGIPLPHPDKPKSRNNNRKQTFDAICRTMLFDIAKHYGLHLDREPEYGGREYLEKQDYILMKQKERIEEQERNLNELTMKIEDVESLVDEVSELAYDKAVEVVTEAVHAETQKEDVAVIKEYKDWLLEPGRKAPLDVRQYTVARLDKVIEKIMGAAQKFVMKVQQTLKKPEIRKTNTDQIKEKARGSILERLHQKQADMAQRGNRNYKTETKKKDMEL